MNSSTSYSATLQLYKLVEVGVDGLSLALLKKLEDRNITLNADLYNKIVENEDLALSLLSSFVSEYNVDAIKISICKDRVTYEYLYFKTDEKLPIIMSSPKLTKVYRIVSLRPASSEGPLREYVVNLKESSNDVKILDLANDEIYSFETPIIKRQSIELLSSNIVLVHTSDGVFLLDPSTITVPEEPKTKSRSKSKTKRKRRKRRKKKSRKSSTK